MASALRVSLLAVAVAAVAALITVTVRPLSAAAALPFDTGHLLGLQSTDEPFERSLGSFTKARLKEGRRLVRGMYGTVSRSFGKWSQWLRRALPFLLVALIAALADPGLVAAWRSDGLRVLATYVPLMLYVYGRLLVSRRVRVAGKLFLLAAFLYGVKRRDLLVDRSAIPGLVDDIALIVVATRTFLSTCSEQLISGFAEEALSWRRRVLTLQRARQR
jgi:uncharacterized membrane protein YkvA (DUF1232 family)